MRRFCALLSGVFLPAIAMAGKDVVLTVTVLDSAADVVPRAVLVFADEGERHVVNAVTGQWTGEGLYPTGGGFHPFARDQQVALRVVAPGYAVAEHASSLEKKKNRTEVVLQTIDAPEVTCLPEGVTLEGDGATALAWAEEERSHRGGRMSEDQAYASCVLGVHAFAATRRWAAREAAVLESWSADAKQAAWDARQYAHTVALDWMDHTRIAGLDAGSGPALCQAASDLLTPCE